MQLKMRLLYIVCFIPFIVLIIFSFWSKTIDLTISTYFFDKDGFSQSPLWSFIYTYATWPAWFGITLAILGSLTSLHSSFTYLKLPCLYFILTLAIGSGLIVHATLKDHWGRPRPKQVIEFGGKQPFQAFYNPRFSKFIEPSKSFSCGHCTMGFCFFALALIGRLYRLKLVEKSGWILALTLGILLSMARVAQGGHFFSDVLVSAMIMWWTAWVLLYLFFKPSQKGHS